MLPNPLPLRPPRSNLFFVLTLSLIASSGCGSPGDTTSSSTPSVDTTATTTVNVESSTVEIAASSTTVTSPDDDAVRVRFDGGTCSLDDAPELAPGARNFVFTNQSDLPVRMRVMVLADGKTYEDVRAIEAENGGPGNSWSGPPWMPEALISFAAPNVDLGANQVALQYNLESGPHAVLAFGTTSPFAIWLCGPLAVTDDGGGPSEVIDVTFDGQVCTATGPHVVPADVQSFVLRDLTGEGAADVRTMAISDDHTYEDLLALQSEPGEYVALPPWAEWPLTTFEPVDRPLGENELGKRLILDPGVHGIVVGTGKGVWFCGSLTVTES